jgi:hypothetical protein
LTAAKNRRSGTRKIAKIIKLMGAPIDDADAKAIAEYLKKNHGG